MKLNNMSQTSLRRAILKSINFEREDSLFPIKAEESCYGIVHKAGQQILLSEATLYGNDKELCVYALAKAVNELGVKGAQAVGAAVHILLPEYAYDSRLKDMLEYLEEAASGRSIQILQAKAEASPFVSSAVVSLNAVGIVEENQLRLENQAKAEQDIVLVGWIGLEGSLRILGEKKEELSQRFVPTFLNQTKDLKQWLFADIFLLSLQTEEVAAIRQVSEGGVLTALWDLTEETRVGMEIEMKNISIRQETVEICEYFSLNPYQMTSTGSFLVVANEGEKLVEELEQQGIYASVLGKTTKDKAKVILSGEEKRFLDRPTPDELRKLYARS